MNAKPMTEGPTKKKPSRRVGKCHRKGETSGRKMSLLERMSAYERGAVPLPQVEICHFSKRQPGRNLSPSIPRAGRNVSPFEQHIRSENVTFEAGKSGGRNLSLFAGESVGRNSSPLTSVAAGRKMSPVHISWVGKRHHCLGTANIVIAGGRQHWVGSCHQLCGDTSRVGICHPLTEYRQRLRGGTDGRRAFSRSCSRGRWGTTRSI